MRSCQSLNAKPLNTLGCAKLSIPKRGALRYCLRFGLGDGASAQPLGLSETFKHVRVCEAVNPQRETFKYIRACEAVNPSTRSLKYVRACEAVNP